MALSLIKKVCVQLCVHNVLSSSDLCFFNSLIIVIVTFLLLCMVHVDIHACISMSCLCKKNVPKLMSDNIIISK